MASLSYREAVRDADVLIYATGFAATDFVTPMTVRGRGNEELSATWKRGAATHLGITVAGFPNLFLLVGPNTGLGHNSVVYMIEAQIDHFLGALRHMRRHRLSDDGRRPFRWAAAAAAGREPSVVGWRGRDAARGSGRRVAGRRRDSAGRRRAAGHRRGCVVAPSRLGRSRRPCNHRANGQRLPKADGPVWAFSG